MPIYLVAAMQSLLYLASVPVCVTFCVSGEGGLKAGAAASRRWAPRSGRGRRRWRWTWPPPSTGRVWSFGVWHEHALGKL